jgi:hypothetical protein
MDSSPMYSNDSNDEGDDDLAPPTMVPRADLQPRASLENRRMEEDEDDFEGDDVEDINLRGSRSHQNYLEMQRRALAEYEQKLEQEYRAAKSNEVEEDGSENIEDLSLEPHAKKIRSSNEDAGDQMMEEKSSIDGIKEEIN